MEVLEQNGALSGETWEALKKIIHRLEIVPMTPNPLKLRRLNEEQKAKYLLKCSNRAKYVMVLSDGNVRVSVEKDVYDKIQGLLNPVT